MGLNDLHILIPRTSIKSDFDRAAAMQWVPDTPELRGSFLPGPFLLDEIGESTPIWQLLAAIRFSTSLGLGTFCKPPFWQPEKPFFRRSLSISPPQLSILREEVRARARPDADLYMRTSGHLALLNHFTVSGNCCRRPPSRLRRHFNPLCSQAQSCR